MLDKAVAARVVRIDKIRADTTVVEANVAYPTDSGLLARGVAKMAGMVRALQGMGLASRTRSMRRRAHAIGAWLRRRSDEAKDEVRAINAEMVLIAEATVAEARRAAVNAARSLRSAGTAASGKARALIGELERTAELTERVVAQTRIRLSGETPEGATRIVSLHDADARPIAKGRLGKPVEFGYKARWWTTPTASCSITPSSSATCRRPMLAAIARIAARFGRAPTP